MRPLRHHLRPRLADKALPPPPLPGRDPLRHYVTPSHARTRQSAGGSDRCCGRIFTIPPHGSRHQIKWEIPRIATADDRISAFSAHCSSLFAAVLGAMAQAPRSSQWLRWSWLPSLTNNALAFGAASFSSSVLCTLNALYVTPVFTSVYQARKPRRESASPYDTSIATMKMYA